MSTILSNPITTTTTGLLLARIQTAFLTKNPAEVAKVWASISREDKIKLVQYRDGTGLTLFHLLMYFMPTNQETSEPYFLTYYPILDWGRHKITQINHIATSLCTAKIINPDDTEFYGYSVSPVTLAASRNHMLSFLALMQSGADMVQNVCYIERTPFSTKYFDIYDTTSCITQNDPFKVSLLMEIYMVKTMRQRYDYVNSRNVDFEIFSFIERRRILVEKIKKARDLIGFGQGEMPYRFDCVPFESSPDFTITPNRFLSLATQALEQYEQQKQVYKRMFGKDYSEANSQFL